MIPALWLRVLSIWMLLLGSVLAQPIAAREIPLELERWRGWVLDELGSGICPSVGANAIDPSLAPLAADSRSGGAHDVVAGSSVTFETEPRGETEPPPNELRLRRDMWLAEDGQSWKVLDHFTGEMRRTFRLDLVDGELGRFAANNQDFLLTQAPATGLAGVEVRQRSLDLVAEWVLHHPTRIPAVGWSEDVKQLDLRLHTPPGWSVIGASGVDELSPGPFARMKPLSLLAIALVAAGLGYLGRPWWGAVSALGLLLATRQADSPLSPWLVALATIAAQRRLPWPAARTLNWAITIATLLVLGTRLTSFAADYATELFIPQGDLGAERWQETVELAERSADDREEDTGTRAKGAEGSMGDPRHTLESALGKRYGGLDIPGGPKADEEIVRASAPPPSKDLVLQLGPGMPQWDHHSWQLSIDGPVKQDHLVRLTLLAPWQNLALGVVELGLLVLGFALLLRLAWNCHPGSASRHSSAVGIAALVALFCFFAPGIARAQIPNEEVIRPVLGTESSPDSAQRASTSTSGFVPTFSPWSGENLTVRLTRPEPVPGSTFTVDSTVLRLEPGPRGMTAALSVAARVSKEQLWSVTIPEGAEVLSLTIDSKTQPVTQTRSLTRHFEPGGHLVELEWKQATPLGLFFRAPAVTFSHGSANAEIRMPPPSRRAVLWLGGPSWGPRTTIWCSWLVLLALSIMLATVPRSPLPWWQWWVLAFGFLPGNEWALLGLVVLWFFAVQARGSSAVLPWGWHNLRQVGLLLLTLCAAIILVARFKANLGHPPALPWDGAYPNHRGDLVWYRDAISGALPRPYLVSVPDWVTRAVYGLWCAVVGVFCFRWGRWAYAQARHEGWWLPRRSAAPAATESTRSSQA